MLHGVRLMTASGTPIHLSTELLRYGGNLSTEERGQELLRVFGFNHLILKESLSYSSLRLYCRDFYAYWQFAGSREAALQPETLARWILSLRGNHYINSTINRMVTVIQSIMRAAGSKGYIDPAVSEAFQKIEKIPASQQSSRSDQDEAASPIVSYKQYYKKCGIPNCSVCELGKGHGPYWYAYVRKEDGKAERRYIGKKFQPIALTE